MQACRRPPITRLTTQWQDEADAFNKRLSLTGTDYVYCWGDGIHLKVRLAQDKVCLLVMIGVRADGTKELIALADGFRESSESWAAPRWSWPAWTPPRWLARSRTSRTAPRERRRQCR